MHVAFDPNVRYFLDADDDGHNYVIPVAKKAEWNEWLALGSEDERAWSVPSYAYEVNGPTSLVTFTNVEVR